jgi:hypothetical protein
VLNGHLQGFSTEEWTLLLQLLQRMLGNGKAMKQLSKSPPSTPSAPPLSI